MAGARRPPDSYGDSDNSDGWTPAILRTARAFKEPRALRVSPCLSLSVVEFSFLCLPVLNAVAVLRHLVLRNQALDDDDIHPLAVETRMLLVQTHLAEAARAAERATGRVERKDP